MGINPIQLFNKSHHKREKYQKINALFARGVFLSNLVEEKEYKIDNFKNKKIKKYLVIMNILMKIFIKEKVVFFF